MFDNKRVPNTARSMTVYWVTESTQTIKLRRRRRFLDAINFVRIPCMVAMRRNPRDSLHLLYRTMLLFITTEQMFD